jgi:hypothetical protein
MEENQSLNSPSDNQPDKPKDDGSLFDNQKEQNIKPEISLETRIVQLENAITKARYTFQKSAKKLNGQIVIWAIISALIVIVSICYAKYLLDINKVVLPDTWTWQVVYYTAIRITIAAAIFSVAAYSFKLLSLHIHLFQQNEHKRAVIDSLPGFVESGIDPDKRDIIFNKLIEMIVHFDDAEIVGKVSELKTGNDVMIKLVEMLINSSKSK